MPMGGLEISAENYENRLQEDFDDGSELTSPTKMQNNLTLG